MVGDDPLPRRPLREGVTGGLDGNDPGMPGTGVTITGGTAGGVVGVTTTGVGIVMVMG